MLAFGNSGVNGGLMLETTPQTFITFNPAALLQHPYNNPWAPGERRENYWEFFVRSAIFGEFNLGDSLKPFATVVLFFWFGTLALSLLGLVYALWKQWYAHVPLIAVGFFQLLGSIAYRLHYACACNQDFRFVPFLIIPISYFAIFATQVLPLRGRILSETWLQVFAFSSALLLIILALSPV